MIRKAKAVWRGTGRAGSGNLSTNHAGQIPLRQRTTPSTAHGTV
jgi:hypothetical protein